MDKTDKFEWNVGEQEIYPIDYTQEELREANNNKISKIGHENIRKRVVMQKWQENFGKEISYMNADEIEIDEELTFRIPIETWEFFTAYALIAQIEKKGIDGSKNPSDFLVHVIADAHIYDRHVPMIEELISREPLPAPKFWLNPEVKDFYDFTPDDVKLEGYETHPQIKNIPIAV